MMMHHPFHAGRSRAGVLVLKKAQASGRSVGSYTRNIGSRWWSFINADSAMFVIHTGTRLCYGSFTTASEK